jgi:hypothetical protein
MILYPQRTLTDINVFPPTGFLKVRRMQSVPFGCLLQSFEFLKNLFIYNEGSVLSVIQAACVLSNFIHIREGKSFNPEDSHIAKDVSL